MLGELFRQVGIEIFAAVIVSMLASVWFMVKRYIRKQREAWQRSMKELEGRAQMAEQQTRIAEERTRKAEERERHAEELMREAEERAQRAEELIRQAQEERNNLDGLRAESDEVKERICAAEERARVAEERIQRNIEVIRQAEEEAQRLANLTTAKAQFTEGMRYYYKEQYKKALPLIQEAAEAGHVEAQFRLGIMYRNGEGTVKDNAKAVQWLKGAAQQGYSVAQYFLSNI